MNLAKSLGLTVVTALALMAVASTASATTLETNGIKRLEPVSFSASLIAGTSTQLEATSGAFANTCSSSTVAGSDSTAFTTLGSGGISGPLTSLTFSNCTHEKVVVHSAGSLSIEWISGTTKGTLRSSGTWVTAPITVFGSIFTASCTTNNVDIGTLNGTATGTTWLTVNGVLNCGSFLPTAVWRGTYTVTGGHSIGVVN
jgi:hypothetical protein